MALELPADAEPFIPDGEPWDYLHEPSVYCLRLTKPDDLAAAWDAVQDRRPAYWGELDAADTVLYVGQTGDTLRRLEQHRDGEQSGVLQAICEIDSVRNIWWMDSKEQAEQEESQLGIMLNNHTDESKYVHFR